MRRRGSSAVFLLALVASGCGYVMAGTWVDDPGNWSRAFHSTKPPDVVVVHSTYWRSPHWTLEYEYRFEIASNAQLREQLLTNSKLRRLAGPEAATAKANSFGSVPPWFAPNAASAYDIFAFDGEPNRNFVVLIDKKSGTLFLSDYQI